MPQVFTVSMIPPCCQCNKKQYGRQLYCAVSGPRDAADSLTKQDNTRYRKFTLLYELLKCGSYYLMLFCFPKNRNFSPLRSFAVRVQFLCCSETNCIAVSCKCVVDCTIMYVCVHTHTDGEGPTILRNVWNCLKVDSSSSSRTLELNCQ